MAITKMTKTKQYWQGTLLHLMRMENSITTMKNSILFSKNKHGDKDATWSSNTNNAYIFKGFKIEETSALIWPLLQIPNIWNQQRPVYTDEWLKKISQKYRFKYYPTMKEWNSIICNNEHGTEGKTHYVLTIGTSKNGRRKQKRGC